MTPNERIAALEAKTAALEAEVERLSRIIDTLGDALRPAKGDGIGQGRLTRWMRG